MTRAVAILRPEPGNARTAARIEALGLVAIRLPLFGIAPLAWSPPDPAAYDALLLTSANAARHAGPGLAALSALPVVAVGRETAAAARAAGLTVAYVGSANADAAITGAARAGWHRLLHLAGRDRSAMAKPLDTIAVYASDVGEVAPADFSALAGSVAMLHSVRSAEQVAALSARYDLDRATVRIAAISDAVALAAGDGWAELRTAAAPDDGTLAQIARDLAIDRPGGRGDKAA